MVAEMPDTARTGEQLGIRLTLFNYQDERIEVINYMFNIIHFSL